MAEEGKGLSDGVDESSGDPRVLLAMNAVLSLLFGWTVIWGLDLLGLLEHTWGAVAGVWLGLFALTYLVVLR
jgi:hypothetical protein